MDIEKVGLLTLQEAASGMHPKWQGGHFWAILRPRKSMGGIVIAIWEKSNFFGSIGSLKCTKNAIFLQGGQNLPPLPLVGLNFLDLLAVGKVMSGSG